MFRRELLKHAAGILFGKHAGPIFADGYHRLAKRPFEEAPTGDILHQMQQIAKNLETIRLGVSVVYDYIFDEFMNDTACPLPTVPKRNHPAWPYLHCLGHCFAVAVLTDLSPAERREWSVWMGLQDELTQAYWAEFYRKNLYPLLVQHCRQEYPDDERQAAIELSTAMSFLFGTERQRARAAAKVKLRKHESYKRLSGIHAAMAPLIDACESAWQRSDLHDNAIGREGGLLCPRSLSTGDKLTWCIKWCNDNKIFRDTPEGPDTDRPWGPFHPINPGPVPNRMDVCFGFKLIPANAFGRHPLYRAPTKLIGIGEA